jgi:periplasmic copper chaperone A
VSRSRPTILVAGALVGALALAGCGAGQVANTAEQVANAPGANTATGPISVRDAVIVFGDTVEGAVYSRGESAPLSMTIVNETGEADRLVSASSPFAQSVEISGTTEIPAGRAVVVQGDTNEQGALAPGGVPTVAPNTTPQPEQGATVVLTGLLDDIRAGVSYPVTFVFERAGEVTVDVPVGNSEEPREEAEGGE